MLILGPSGSGKTTLLCLLAALQKPTSGIIKYDDIDINQLKPFEMDKFRGQNLGIIFQNYHLINSLNVYQNIAIASKITPKKVDHNQIIDHLEQLGLKDKAKQKTSTLSIGQAQRLAVIRSLINNPKWILCDEPTSALDVCKNHYLI